MRDKELIKIIKEDPDKGIRLAVEEYGGVVKAICNNVLRGFNKDEIEEAWSDTFFKLWKNAGRFDEEKNASLKTYIGTIARNVALDVRRKSVRKTADGLTNDMADSAIDPSVNIEDDYAKAENEKALRETVEEMDEPDRTIFILRYFSAATVKEIAETLALKPKQIENILSRRKGDLKVKLEERGISNDQ